MSVRRRKIDIKDDDKLGRHIFRRRKIVWDKIFLKKIFPWLYSWIPDFHFSTNFFTEACRVFWRLLYATINRGCQLVSKSTFLRFSGGVLKFAIFRPKSWLVKKTPRIRSLTTNEQCSRSCNHPHNPPYGVRRNPPLRCFTFRFSIDHLLT